MTSRWCWHTVEPRRPNRPSASSPDTSNSFCWQSFHSLFSWGSGLPLTWQRVSGRRHLHSFAFSIYGEVLYILMFLCAMPYNPIASYGMTIVTHHRSKSFILKWTFSILMAEKTCLSNGIATQDGSLRQKENTDVFFLIPAETAWHLRFLHWLISDWHGSGGESPARWLIDLEIAAYVHH